eukprot:gene13237-20451_t
MRAVLGALWMIATVTLAAPAPLRFSISDSWTMPMVQLDQGQPTQGILYDLMLSLATQVGRPAIFHVLPRARIDTAMERGDVDVRCYVTPAWLNNLLAPQHIGTVLGYSYPTLEARFASGQFSRDDSRSEEQVLQKLVAGRFNYAVINEWILDRFNQQLPPTQRLHTVAVIEEQRLGCYVRNDPQVPGQQILRTLLRMKMSGEIDEIIQLYIGNSAPAP